MKFQNELKDSSLICLRTRGPEVSENNVFFCMRTIYFSSNICEYYVPYENHFLSYIVYFSKSLKRAGQLEPNLARMYV